MSQDVIDPNLLRQYLLGAITEEEQRAVVEERLLVDDDFFEEFQLVKEDLFDQYVSDELTLSERESFEQHFLTTPERRENLRHNQALARYARKHRHEATEVAEKKTRSNPDASRLRFPWTWLLPARSWRFATSLILIIGFAVVIWRIASYRSDVEQGLLALKTAYRLQRPVEARVSALDYAPLPNTRGNGETRIDSISRQRAERFLLDAVNDDPGPASYHALGLFYLTDRKFDQGIAQFKKALEGNPNDAQLHSDLAAALLEKGKLDRLNDEEGKGVEEFAESLEHLNRALTLNPALLDALFNRALCRQYMGLPQLAAEDWRQYLEKDSQSAWADEARQNLKLIELQTPKTSQNKEEVLQSFLNAYMARDDETAWQFLSMNRDVTGAPVENELLDRYLNLEANGRLDEANESLHALSYAGELELKRANDRFVNDLLAFYQASTRAQRASLAGARSLMSQGHGSLQTFKPELAVEYYSKAKQIFDELGDEAESLYIRYPRAHAYLLMHQSEKSLAMFEEVVRKAETKQYRWLLSQSLSGVGNVQTSLDDYSAALDSNNRSLEISEQIGDIKGLMKTSDQLSNVYTRLGDYRKAIERQTQGLTLINKYHVEPHQAWRSHFLMATPLHLLGLNAAAEIFQKESLRIAQESGNPYYICRSYIGLGIIYGSQHKYDEATNSVRLAFDLAQTISSEAIRTDTVGYSSLQLGHLYRQAGDFNKAMASYDEVLKAYAGAGYQGFLYAAHKGRLLSCLAQGGCPTVEREVEATLHLFENYRSKILEEENNFVFFDVEQNVYDAIIEYEYSINKNTPAAFDLSERSRARSLLGLTTQESPAKTHSNHKRQSGPFSLPPLGFTEIRQRMPEQSQILQYSVLPQMTLIWLVSASSGIQSFELRIDAKDLRDKVSRYLQLISFASSNNEEDLKSASAEFYDLLVRPFEGSIDRNKQLCIVPDKALNYLPYGAFVSRSSGKYLTEEYVLTRAPSSTLFIVSSDNARDRDRATAEKLLSVGNPRFDRAAFPMLGDLPSAQRESEEIARLYQSSPPITGDKALKSRVVTEIEGADVIHLALHAVVNEHSPLRSKLLFARDKSSQDWSSAADTLEISEIYKLRLPQTRVIVLSACQSGAGRYYDGEGMIGISRPFIAKGVPLVVASLWPVDSDATAELMVSFHGKRKTNGLSTAEALTAAQREMLQNTDKRYRHPYYWASFVTIGAYARF